MPAVWPATLPQVPFYRGFGIKPPSSVVETPNSLGPPNSRRRAPAAPVLIPWPMKMTATQRETFWTFYVDTLKQGCLPMEFPHPYKDGETLEGRIIDVGEITPKSSDYWKTILTIRVMM